MYCWKAYLWQSNKADTPNLLHAEFTAWNLAVENSDFPALRQEIQGNRSSFKVNSVFCSAVINASPPSDDRRSQSTRITTDSSITKSALAKLANQISACSRFMRYLLFSTTKCFTRYITSKPPYLPHHLSKGALPMPRSQQNSKTNRSDLGLHQNYVSPEALN